MTPVRCPKCGRLLGYFDGKGEVVCPRCRKDVKVQFDTERNVVKIKTEGIG
jgi:uncharacterized Zn finger protein (UPF0148 family)